MSILGQLDALVDGVKKIPVFLKIIFLPVFTILGIGYAIISYTLAGLNKVLDVVDEKFSDLDLTVAGHSLDTIASDFWTTVNTFIPLDTVFSLAAVLLSLRLIMMIVRVIKSWIPTVS